MAKRKYYKAHRRKRGNNMARRRGGRFGRVRRVGRGIGSSLRTGMLGEAIKGLGAAALASIVLSRIAPQYMGIGRPLAGYAGGGAIGAIAVVASDYAIGSFSAGNGSTSIGEAI